MLTRLPTVVSGARSRLICHGDSLMRWQICLHVFPSHRSLFFSVNRTGTSGVSIASSVIISETKAFVDSGVSMTVSVFISDAIAWASTGDEDFVASSSWPIFPPSPFSCNSRKYASVIGWGYYNRSESVVSGDRKPHRPSFSEVDLGQ